MRLAIIVVLVAGLAAAIIYITLGTLVPLPNSNHSNNSTQAERSNEQPIKISDSLSLKTTSIPSPPEFGFPSMRLNETGKFVYQDPGHIGVIMDICGNFGGDPVNVPGNPEHPAIVKRGGDEVAIPFCYWSKSITEETWVLKASGSLSSLFLDKGIHVRFDRDSFHTPAFSSILDEYMAAKAAGGNFTVFVRTDDTAELGQHLFLVDIVARHQNPSGGFASIGNGVYIDVRNE